MDYYKDVYLKRINRFGSTKQERIINKMKYQFENSYLKNTINKVDVLVNNELIIGSLQEDKQSESKTLFYLLVSTDYKWPMGTELIINGEKWLILHLEEFVTKGYNKYKIIKLVKTIKWINSNKLIETADVYLIGELEKAIKSDFKIQYGISAGVYKPNKVLSMIMASNPSLEKTANIMIENEAWKVSGIDKISVPGVYYITLEETIANKEDTDLANEESLEYWTIETNYGTNFEVGTQQINIVFTPYYFNNNRNEENIIFEISDMNSSFDFIIDKNTIKTSLINYVEGATATITARIERLPEKTFSFKISAFNGTVHYPPYLFGPSIIKSIGKVTYGDADYTKNIVISKNNLFKINDISSGITIDPQEIGEDSIIVKDSSTLDIITERDISIKSIWIGG